MHQAPDSMRTALRVLTAVIERRDPHPADLEELRRFAPLLANAAPDELARDVVRAMKRRFEMRRAPGSFRFYELSSSAALLD